MIKDKPDAKRSIEQRQQEEGLRGIARMQNVKSLLLPGFQTQQRRHHPAVKKLKDIAECTLSL